MNENSFQREQKIIHNVENLRKYEVLFNEMFKSY